MEENSIPKFKRMKTEVAHIMGGAPDFIFWVGHGPSKNFFGWVIMHLAHPKNAGAK
jgi:hypothetical protein